ncbi:hypothetical protein CGLO_09891 [Colletotrichum gloeosporioides Cg-14]|uniref:Uncharacterized protein n=1 Tax=Colletotrichum gloeosporioides (strain Cg-14) TaxID=1237896 RepID=T0LGA9_COLGC|nr:hypothetical protein CGLO_09891 [Colletotrichum gloeosporioides Cg-14]
MIKGSIAACLVKRPFKCQNDGNEYE